MQTIKFSAADIDQQAAPPAAPVTFAAQDIDKPADARERDWIDTLTDWLPTIGGAAGGVVGGIGGTVLGMGVGGAPGAIGGATVGGMAGEAYKQLIRRARGQETPASAGEAATGIGVQGAIQGGAQAAGAALAPAMTAVGSRIMQSAVKPGIKTLMRGLKTGDPIQPVVKTLLDEGVNVTPRGVAKLQTLLNATNADIKTAVSSTSGDVSPLKVAGRLNQTARTFAQQVNPQADLEAISKVGENFLEANAAPMGLSTAQALKEGTYAQIGKKYGQLSPAGIEAEKALARGLKEEIASKVPGVSKLNAREGQLLEALDQVGRRVALAGNRDPIGFAWVVQNPTTFLAALMDRSPAVKSMLARGMYASAAVAGKTTPELIRVAVQALATEGASADDSSSGPGRR